MVPLEGPAEVGEGPDESGNGLLSLESQGLALREHRLEGRA